MLRVPALVSLVALGAACARPPARAPALPVFEAPAPVSAGTLEADLRATVLETYEARGAGFEEAWLDSLSHDARLLLVSVGPDDVVLGGWNPAACRRNRPFRERPATIVSKALETHLSADGTVAWTFDELSYRFDEDGRQVIVPLRATGVWERREGRWVNVTEHISYAVPDEQALADAAAGRISRGKPFGQTTTRGAEEAREVLLRLLRDEPGDKAAREAHVATDPGSLSVGSDPERELRGPAIAEAPTVRAMFGYDLEPHATDLRVLLSRSGQVAWGAANVLVEGKRDDRALALPLRATWVLEKRDGAWKVVQTHLSVPVGAPELARRVFGEPITLR